MKKEFIIGMMVLTASFVFVSCSKDDEVNETALGINDDQASEPPVVTINTVNIPNMSAPYIEEGSNGNVGNISFTGIKGTDGQYINLVGTDGGANQNIWLTIDNIQKAIKIVNAGRGNSMPAADVVFLIDDSGSMGEEADSVAKQVVAWSKVLAQVVDTRFACIGYGDGYDYSRPFGMPYGIDGGMDLDIIDSLSYFLNNREGRWGGLVSGTMRTMGFWGKAGEKLSAARNLYPYNGGGSDECGALALHFADEQLSFREGANRIYLNFTDEPNFAYNDTKWSVESVNSENTEVYNWSAEKGTIHTIFSADSSGYYYHGYYEERPWLMSDYTGGTKLFTNSYLRGINLGEIEVTGAITNTYVMRFNITPDLRTGIHTLTITVKDKNGQAIKQASMTFTFE